MRRISLTPEFDLLVVAPRQVFRDVLLELVCGVTGTQPIPGW